MFSDTIENSLSLNKKREQASRRNFLQATDSASPRSIIRSPSPSSMNSGRLQNNIHAKGDQQGDQAKVQFNNEVEEVHTLSGVNVTSTR